MREDPHPFADILLYKEKETRDACRNISGAMSACFRDTCAAVPCMPADPEGVDLPRTFIKRSPCEEGLARFAVDRAASYGLFRELIDTTAGCTVCTRCGPNTPGLLFMRK